MTFLAGFTRDKKTDVCVSSITTPLSSNWFTSTLSTLKRSLRHYSS